MTNTGIEMPVIAKPITTLSSGVFCRNAATIPIPNDSSLHCRVFFNQALVVDAVNALGLTASNAGMGCITL